MKVKGKYTNILKPSAKMSAKKLPSAKDLHYLPI
jgi:hypothetical protein